MLTAQEGATELARSGLATTVFSPEIRWLWLGERVEAFLEPRCLPRRRVKTTGHEARFRLLELNSGGQGSRRIGLYTTDFVSFVFDRNLLSPFLAPC